MGVKRKNFLEDTRAADTIPLKMVFYLVITCVIIILTAFAWNSLAPVYTGMKDSRQINDAFLELRSIQDGYPRNIIDPNSPEGSICTVKLSIPQASYLAFGVDPDPDMNGNLSDSAWVQENNTVICQYKSGSKDRYYIEGDSINFKKGIFDNTTGKWIPDGSQDENRSLGVVIEEPLEGDFNFELVLADKKYTLTNFEVL